MSLIHRQDFSGGWNPSQDLINGRPNALVRLDNLVLDDQGILSLRKGSVTVSGPTPLHPVGAGTYRVNSFFTCTLTTPSDGIERRVRYAGIDNALYRSESVGYWNQIGSNYTGDGDIHLAEMFGQVFSTRGTTHYKNDGTSTRWWGIEAPASAPSLSAEPSNRMTISNFGNTSGWVAINGKAPVGAEGWDGVDDGAREFGPSTDNFETTARYTVGGLFDLTRFADGEESTDLDQIEFWVYLTYPNQLQSINLQIDANSAVPFAEDYYYYDVFSSSTGISPGSSALSDKEWAQMIARRPRPVSGSPLPPGTTPDHAKGPGSEVGSIGGAPGWQKFSVPKVKFHRVGNKSDRDWSTIKAVQVTIIHKRANIVVRFDDMTLIGGAQHPLTGDYQACAVLYADFGTHIVRSGPSPVSDLIKLQANALWVNIDIGDTELPKQYTNAGGPGDPTVGVEIYLMGNGLTQFYRFSTQQALQGVVTVLVEKSAEDAAIENVVLDRTLTTPPDNIIGMVTNHFRRNLVLTRNKLYPSVNGNPESFPERFAISLGTNVVAYWIVRHQEEILLGTNIDIFRLEGSGDEYPDGTIGYALRRLNISEPPTSEAVVTEGNMLIYLAADGWRIFKGLSSESLRGSIDLMYKGHTRYGVGPASVGTTMGRFRAGLFNGNFYSITPEVSGADYSRYIWVYSFLRQAWYRFVYPKFLTALYREPDGELLAGDSLGSIWRMEVGDLGDVRYEDLALQPVGTNPYTVTGQAIPIQAWTISDSNNDPLSLKDPFDFRVECETGSAVLTANLYSDETASWSSSIASLGAVTTVARDLNGMTPFKRAQVRFSGSFYTFKLNSFSIIYRPRPVRRMRWDSGYADFGTGTEMVWIRQIMVKVRGSVSGAGIGYEVWFDGYLRASGTVTIPSVLVGTETHYTIPVDRFCHGRQFRLVLFANGDGISDAFELYWAEVTFKGTQTYLQKKVLTAKGVEA